jgi:plastocyanin
MNTNKILRAIGTLFLTASAAFILVNCGSGGGDGSCDPEFDEECVCETEYGATCDDPDDLDCFCFSEDSTTAGAEGRLTIELFDNAFDQQEITVRVGTQVTWVNKDQVQHTVTFADGSIDELLNPGASFTTTFDSEGTFTYTDRLHVGPGLHGKIIVE